MIDRQQEDERASSDFDPKTMLERQRRQLRGKTSADVNDSAFVLREGLFARSRPIDSARPVMPSLGRAANTRLSQLNELLKTQLNNEVN